MCRFLLIPTLLVNLSIAIGCDSGFEHSVQRGETISVAMLSDVASSPGYAIVDVRSRGAYVRGHIPGARSIPLSSLSQPSSLPKEGTVVVYCD